MNVVAGILLAVALALSVLDWVAVSRGSKVLEYVFKPSAAAAFLVTALVLDVGDSSARWLVVAALVFSLAGDVFLMLPRDAFIAGLGSFAVAQVLFAAGFLVREPTLTRTFIGLVLIVPGAGLLAGRFVRSLVRRDHGSVARAVVVYIVLISFMATSSIAGGTGLGIAGALLFLVSDSLIAEHRFVTERRWQPMAIIVTYHLALTGLVLGLV